MRRSARIVGTGAVIALAAGAAALGAAQAPGSATRATATHATTATVGPIDYMEPRPHHRVTYSVQAAAAEPQLTYQGGVGGIGVETAPKVYVVFYGSQWGKATRVSGVGWKFGKDTKGVAPYLQRFLNGLYGKSDRWSTSTIQYCQGIAAQASCTSQAAYTRHMAVKPLAGVWYLNTEAAPKIPTDTLLGSIAVRAAAHFGNTTAASNASTQYVIALPSGATPDGFTTQYCAYHSFASSVQTGPVAFTNLPYLPDAGYACGQSILHTGTAGLLDGVSIVEGHEYAETVTDQFPAGGWVDQDGEENGDKCAWITSGQGAVTDVTLTTGKFAVQSLWSNNFAGHTGGCVTYYSSATNQH